MRQGAAWKLNEPPGIHPGRGPTCYWCRAPLTTIVIDHYIPFSRGGRTTVENPD